MRFFCGWYYSPPSATGSSGFNSDSLLHAVCGCGGAPARAWPSVQSEFKQNYRFSGSCAQHPWLHRCLEHASRKPPPHPKPGHEPDHANNRRNLHRPSPAPSTTPLSLPGFVEYAPGMVFEPPHANLHSLERRIDIAIAPRVVQCILEHMRFFFAQ